MKTLVLNIPYASVEQDLSDVIFKPDLTVPPDRNLLVIAGDQAKLLEATSRPETLLVNCVSFASDAPDVVDENGEPFDVCVAYNDDDSKPGNGLVSIVSHQVQKAGNYNVGENSSFLKNIVASPNCSTFTIALNRKLYLDESSREMLPSASKWNQLLNTIYSAFLNTALTFMTDKQQRVLVDELFANHRARVDRGEKDLELIWPSPQEFVYELFGEDAIVFMSKATPLPEKRLLCEFNNGKEYRIFDFKPLLDKKGFLGLQDDEIFKNVDCSNGVPNWDNERIDIAPEHIYEHGTPLTKEEYEEYLLQNRDYFS